MSAGKWGQIGNPGPSGTSIGTTGWQQNIPLQSPAPYPGTTKAKTFSMMVENLVSELFNSKDIEDWAVDNVPNIDGIYTRDIREAFIEHVKHKLKAVLLAPKLVLTMKVPKEVGDKI